MLQIFMVLMLLGAAAGGWSAWRRSPVYSTKKTFQMAGAVLLMLALIVGMGQWITGGRLARQSPVSAAALMVGVALLASAGGIMFVLRTSDDYFVKLPASVAPVHFHRHRLRPWFKRAGILLLVFAAMLFLPSFWWVLGAVFGGFYLLIVSIILLSLYAKAGRYDRGMASLLANPWVHWEYTPAQWRAWADALAGIERAKAWRFDRKKAWPGVLGTIVGFAVIAVIDRGDPKMPLLIGFCIASVVLMLVGVERWSRGEADRKRRRVLAGTPRAYFGADGLLCGNEYTPWLLSGNYLVEATVNRDPPQRLVLGFEVFTGNDTSRVDRFVPLPAGPGRDLELLDKQLRARYPRADVRIA